MTIAVTGGGYAGRVRGDRPQDEGRVLYQEGNPPASAVSAVPRIASLLPSSTEIVCALELRDALVGRSHECDHPAGVESLPALTEPKLDAQRRSREIDDRVAQLVRDGLSVYRVDADALRELSPDLILTQDQCEVCAASLADVEEALGQWTGATPRVLSLDPRRLADVWRDVERVADACGVAERGSALTRALRDRCQTLSRRAEGGASPRVACLEWIDPLMAAGNWVPELVARAGGVNLFGEAGEHSPWLEWKRLRDSDPDVVVVLPCGFDIPRIRRELAPLCALPGWDALGAVRAGRVYLVDGNQYFNRPGPRLADSLQILCEILHPERFAPSLEGAGWVQLEEPPR